MKIEKRGRWVYIADGSGIVRIRVEEAELLLRWLERVVQKGKLEG